MSTCLISAIIITHRQDERLKKTLASISFADEIIVIDQRPNKTNWPEWMKNEWMGADQLKILDYSQSPPSRPLNNFAQIRNWAMKQAKHDWVFFIDSDEWLKDPNLACQQIKSAINKSKQAWKIKRQDLFLGHYLKYGEAANQWHTRLINKKHSQFSRPVHEIIKTDGVIGKLDLKLIHQAHLGISEFLKDISRYALLEAKYRYFKNGQSYQTSIFNFYKLLLKLMIYPTAKFTLNYFLKLGFLDGKPGLIYAVMMSLHSALVRIFQLELCLKKR